MVIQTRAFSALLVFCIAFGGGLSGLTVLSAMAQEDETGAPAGGPTAESQDAVEGAQEPSPFGPPIAAPPAFAEAEGLAALSGLLTLYPDPAKGRVLMVLPAADEAGLIGRYIYVEYLAAGLGSNPVGLDRSQDGRSYIVAFRRIGGKVFIEVENSGYLADSNDPRERAAVRQSFATSIIWSGEIMGEDEAGAALIDISSFLVRDVHGVAARLKAAQQGSFSLDKGLSVVDANAALAFPQNIDMEALVTFTSSEPGPEVRATTPEPRNITLRLHHSFVALPDDDYEPRLADPRAGVIAMMVADYAVPLSAPIEKRYAVRHRLQKTNPDVPRSPVVEPIIYYVDPGAPEPVKSALIEGASWWAEAFEAAGFIGGYRVEELPVGAHPLDIRYNMINWVHRQTRGWSYGSSVVDPRTGEIIKGNVLLGSLRVRQDRMIFEGLVGADLSGRGGANDSVQVALARIRQLSAHEVGHTLGFPHNMGASTINRASVMDYPAPEVAIVGGNSLDLSNAYGVGVGPWDMFTVKWLYSQFPEGADEGAALEQFVADGYASGLRYVADSDSRPVGSGHPYGNLWDTGAEPVASLRHMMRVRAVALSGFGARNIAPGRPMSELANVLVPIYLFHRYQVEAATKPLGGLVFEYGLRGDSLSGPRPADAAWQRDALEAVLETITPAALDLPDHLLDLLGPANRDFSRGAGGRESFPSSSVPVFDLLSAADSAAEISLGHLLHSRRLARMVEFNRRNSQYPGADFALNRVRAALFDRAAADSPRQRAIRQRVQTRYVSILTGLGVSPTATPEVRAVVDAHLTDISQRLTRSRVQAMLGAAHAAWLRSRIERYLTRPAGPEAAAVAPPAVPPGSPIGGSSDLSSRDADSCWHC